MGVFDKFKDLVGIEEIDDRYDEDDKKELQAERKKVDNKGNFNKGGRGVVSIGGNRNTSPFKLVVIEPEGFEECPKLVDSLKARRPIIINLEKTDSDTARKIFDFLSGATYALNGNVQKVANNIFVFAPENVDIAATGEGKGFDFSGTQKNNWR